MFLSGAKCHLWNAGSAPEVINTTVPKIQTTLNPVKHLAPRFQERDWASIWSSQLDSKFSKYGLFCSLRTAPLDTKNNGCLKGRIREGGHAPRVLLVFRGLCREGHPDTPDLEDVPTSLPQARGDSGRQ